MSGNIEVSEIQEFYKDQTIFLTGVTGFLGKAILEKILRSCPGVKKIYILVRSKHGTNIESRVKNILLSPIFNRLKLENPSSLQQQKVNAIQGDILLPNLGISSENRKILSNEVNVVIHSAASVNFTEKLSDAMNINYYGTEKILNLCYTMKNLKALTHISTAYSNCELKETNEEVYTPSPFITASEIKALGERSADNLVKTIIGSKQNTYIFSKCLAENLLKNHQLNLPISIVRPSIIYAAFQEPVPGYVDSLNGLTGIAAGIGKGIGRHMIGNGDKVGDLIPLDMVTNLAIAAAWKTGSSSKPKLKIYNCCSGSMNPITWAQVRNNLVESFSKIRVKGFLSKYPSFWFIQSRHLNMFLNWFLLLVPFLLLDIFSIVQWKKSRMLKTYSKVTTSLHEIQYFILNDFKFVTNNMRILASELNDYDKKLFYWNVKEINWKEYLFNSCLGIKYWIFKEK